jgi:hypothetical protein
MISTMTTITATAATNQIKKPKAAASERIGFGGCFKAQGPARGQPAQPSQIT